MKQITPETLYDFQFVSNPRFSPDGKHLAFVVQQADKENNTYKGDLYLLTDAGPMRLTAMGDAKSLTWTPDNTLLFPAARSDEDRRLKEKGEFFTSFYEISPEGGEATHAFTLPCRVLQLRHLEGTRYACLVSYDAVQPTLEAMDEPERAKKLKELSNPLYHTFEDLPFWSNGNGIVAGKRSRLFVYDRADGSLTPVTDMQQEVACFDCRGGHLLYCAASHTGLRSLDNGIYLYDCTARSVRTLLEPGLLRVTNALFWGDSILVLGSDGAKYGRNQTVVFYRLNPVDGSLSLFADYDRGVGSGVASDARLGSGQIIKALPDKVLFLSIRDHLCHLRALGADGTVSESLTPDCCIDSFDCAGDRLAYVAFVGDGIAELHVNGEQKTHFNDWLLRDYSVITPEHHRFTDADGFEIDGWALRPAGFEEGKTYPAILHIHGGPRSLFGELYHHEMQVWANAGYFVFYCNPRGSDGKGDAFADVWGHYGTYDYDNLMQFTDVMLKAYPMVDPARVGVTGGSYGGFMTNWIIGHTNRFCAAVSQRSIANWISFEHTTDIGYYFNLMQHKANTRQNASYLWDISPLKYAPNCTTPTLFIHSEEDYRCWMPEGLSMFTALKFQGCPAKLCLFHGENHELSRSGRPNSRMARMREILSWMDQYCKASV